MNSGRVACGGDQFFVDLRESFLGLSDSLFDGFEFTRRMRASPDTEHIPIIMLSSEEDPEIKAMAFAAAPPPGPM